MNTYIHVCIFHKASLKIRQKKVFWLRSSLYEIFLYLNYFVLNHYTHKAFEFVHIYKAPAPADIFDLNLFTKDILKKWVSLSMLFAVQHLQIHSCGAILKYLLVSISKL